MSTRVRLGERGAAIAPELFGHFLERASWGESGPERAWQAAAPHLRPDCLQALRELSPALVRFPGGSDVDYTDWRDLISGAPGRADPARPLTRGHTGQTVANRFGLHEFCALRDALGFEVLWCVKVLTAFLEREPLGAVAHQAAALVAYLNAPLDADLPAELAVYPRLRAANGHEAPFGVRRFQLGNETWFQLEGSGKAGTLPQAYPDAAAAAFCTCLRTIGEAMLAVDPTIGLIVDAPPRRAAPASCQVMADPWVREHVSLLACHAYAPGPLEPPTHRDQSERAVTAEELWYAWVAQPGGFDASGQAQADGERYRWLAEAGWDLAVTEWNWNGFPAAQGATTCGLAKDVAAMLGATGFLHGMLRHADVLRLATQSMLLGHSWDLALIHYDFAAAQEAAHYAAHGAAAKLYRHHHGERLVATTVDGPCYEQPWATQWAPAQPTVAYLDVVATADAQLLYLHVINRDHAREQALSLDPGAWRLSGAGRWWSLGGAWRAADAQSDHHIDLRPLASGSLERLMIPPRSVNVIAIPVTGG
ncbi:MAG: hypothetical protein ACOCYP_10700 [Planctomycetota bacterium]